MKIVIIGMGSIGSRHYKNICALRPDAVLAGYDPVNQSESFEDFMDKHVDADAVVIASPIEYHYRQLHAVISYGVKSIFVEKPLCSVEQWGSGARGSIKEVYSAFGGSDNLKVAMAFNYRFWLDADLLAAWRSSDTIAFWAHDDLLKRYGKTCLETMGSHSLDLALYAFGPTRHVELETDGLYVFGYTVHKTCACVYDLRIDGLQDADRVWRSADITSFSGNKRLTTTISMSNDPYVAEMRAWLEWIEGGERDPRLATLEDGMRCMDVMAQCKFSKGE